MSARALVHGTEGNYARGCRCADCTVFHSDFLEGRVPEDLRLMPAEPWRIILLEVAERLEADPERLAAGCGISRRIARGIISGHYHRITSYTDGRLRKLLELLPSEEPADA